MPKFDTFLPDFIDDFVGDVVEAHQHAYGALANVVTPNAPMQFAPGVVTDVCIHDESPSSQKPKDINSILAVKHSEFVQNKNLTGERFYPLLRGTVDTPVKGDQVLLCRFAGESYYLGPLNTLNSPNFNVDTLNSPMDQQDLNTDKTGEKKSIKDGLNIPKNYKIVPVSRLQKVPNKKLDDPKDENYGQEGSISKTEPFGDLIMEGRYGNSIRVGSRSVYPKLVISNGRNIGLPFETSFDGSILSMTQNGSIRDHYYNFQLSSDKIEENNRKIGAGNVDEDEGFEGVYNYNWGNDVNDENIAIPAANLFMASDKITFNSRKEAFTISSLTNIDFGAGGNFTVNTMGHTTIESKNIYLGKECQYAIKDDKDKAADKGAAQPLVLGRALADFLAELVNILYNSNGLVNGVAVPLVGPLGPSDVLKPKFEALLKQLGASPGLPGVSPTSGASPFWSEYHYIENNAQKVD